MIGKQEKNRAMLTTAHYDFQKGLNAHAFFKVHDHSVGEDMVQDTFMKTWIYIVKGGKIEVMKAFLYHVLNNLIVDGYRKHKTTSFDALIEKGFEPSEVEPARIVNILDGKSLVLLITRLPIKYQNIMNMKFVRDLSLGEISLITGQSKNTVAVQIHRGLAKLKILYKGA